MARINVYYVFLAWRRLYGWPKDYRLYVAFLLHDIGYAGLHDLDGDEGQRHPLRGANLMGRLFDRGETDTCREGRWWRFTGAHSRTYAAMLAMPHSPLMAVDKLATATYPRWRYALLCWTSGVYVEYRGRWAAAGTYPVRADDGAWAYCGHLQRNWARFKVRGAAAGRAYGGE